MNNYKPWSIRIFIISAVALSWASWDNSIFAQEENVTLKSGLSMWTDTISPIAVASIAIVGGYFAGTRITQSWKEREKKLDLELKERDFEFTLISDIEDCVMRIVVAIMRVEEHLSTARGRSPSLDDDSANQYNDFLIRGHIIQSKIRTYFPNEQALMDEWNKLIDYVKFAKQLSENEDAEKRACCVKEPKLVNPKTVEELLIDSGKRYKDRNRKGDFKGN